MLKNRLIQSLFILILIAPAHAQEPEVFVQWGHFPFASINAVAFSNDGRLALSGSDDNTLKLWEVQSGREIRTVKAHSSYVNAVALSNDGRLALSGSDYDGTLKLWEIESGREIRTFYSSIYVTAVALSNDGRLALSGGDTSLELWDVQSGREIRTFNTDYSRAMNALAFSNDGRLALSASSGYPSEAYKSRLKLWDLESGREIRTFKGHSDDVDAVALSNDGRLALSNSYPGTFRLWDIGSGREIRTFKAHSSWLKPVALSNDGRLALSGSYMWDIGSGRKIRTFKGHSYDVNAVAFSNDGRLALSGSDDNTLKLWEVESGREIRTFKGHSDDVNAVALSNDGRLALSGSYDKTLKLWEVDSGREIRTFKGHSDDVNAVALSNDGRLALSGSGDKTLKLWDIDSGREIRTFKGHSDYVNAVALSNDGRLALSGSRDGSIRFWNTQTGDEIAQMVGFEDGEWATVTGQGYYVASSDGEKYINATVGSQVSSIVPYRRQFKRPDLVAAILQAGKLDRQPPRLQIYSKQRGIENDLVLDTYRYTLRGRAIDDSKIATVTVNGKPVHQIDPQGYFNQSLPLQVGQNRVHITATDIFDNTAHKTLNLNYAPKVHQTLAGQNYALVIGINDYQHDKVTDLDTAVNDALAIASRLRNDYHFKVTTLINAQATRNRILDAFIQMADQAQAQDNLLVYYAGHGQRHRRIDKAYWFPVDAHPKAEYTWIIADRITAYMKSSQATNVLVIADSCYSGALAKTRNVGWLSNPKDHQSAIARFKQTKSRILIASGGDKPVSDGDGGKHSIFAEALIEGLDLFKAFQKDFTATELFLYVRQHVAGNSTQLPGIHFIRNSGHDDGDFVFELR
jgi:WD40 repeat protein